MCFLFSANLFWDNPIFFGKKTEKNNNYYLMNSYFISIILKHNSNYITTYLIFLEPSPDSQQLKWYASKTCSFLYVGDSTVNQSSVAFNPQHYFF